MTDVAYAPAPYGPATIGRGLQIVIQIREKVDSTGWHPKDISPLRWTYLLRAWVGSDVTTFILNETINKSPTASTSGWLDGYVSMGDVSYSVLEWEITEVDNDNTDTTTPSGRQERILQKWRQPILFSTAAGTT